MDGQGEELRPLWERVWTATSRELEALHQERDSLAASVECELEDAAACEERYVLEREQALARSRALRQETLQVLRRVAAKHRRLERALREEAARKRAKRRRRLGALEKLLPWCAPLLGELLVVLQGEEEEGDGVAVAVEPKEEEEGVGEGEEDERAPQSSQSAPDAFGGSPQGVVICRPPTPPAVSLREVLCGDQEEEGEDDRTTVSSLAELLALGRAENEQEGVQEAHRDRVGDVKVRKSRGQESSRKRAGVPEGTPVSNSSSSGRPVPLSPAAVQRGQGLIKSWLLGRQGKGTTARLGGRHEVAAKSASRPAEVVDLGDYDDDEDDFEGARKDESKGAVGGGGSGSRAGAKGDQDKAEDEEEEEEEEEDIGRSTMVPEGSEMDRKAVSRGWGAPPSARKGATGVVRKEAGSYAEGVSGPDLVLDLGGGESGDEEEAVIKGTEAGEVRWSANRAETKRCKKRRRVPLSRCPDTHEGESSSELPTPVGSEERSGLDSFLDVDHGLSHELPIARVSSRRLGRPVGYHNQGSTKDAGAGRTGGRKRGAQEETHDVEEEEAGKEEEEVLVPRKRAHVQKSGASLETCSSDSSPERSEKGEGVDRRGSSSPSSSSSSSPASSSSSSPSTPVYSDVPQSWALAANTMESTAGLSPVAAMGRTRSPRGGRLPGESRRAPSAPLPPPPPPPPSEEGAQRGGKSGHPSKGFKYHEVVRNKAERQEMTAVPCECCRGIYEDLPAGVDRDRVINECCKHRYRHGAPPSTPDSFWSLPSMHSSSDR